MNWDTELTYSNLFPNPGPRVRPEHAYVPPHDRSRSQRHSVSHRTVPSQTVPAVNEPPSMPPNVTRQSPIPSKGSKHTESHHNSRASQLFDPDDYDSIPSGDGSSFRRYNRGLNTKPTWYKKAVALNRISDKLM